MLTFIIIAWLVINIARGFAEAQGTYQQRDKPPYTMWGEDPRRH